MDWRVLGTTVVGKEDRDSMDVSGDVGGDTVDVEVEVEVEVVVVVVLSLCLLGLGVTNTSERSSP